MGERGKLGSLDATGLRVAIVAARYNPDIVESLVEGASAALAEHGAPGLEEAVRWVPGCFEIPIAALALAGTGRVDAIVGLGCVIQGETAHFEHVATGVARGLMDVGLRTGVPCAFGVLTTYTREQARARAQDAPRGAGNKGREAAEAAIEMANLLRGIRASTP
ncbi:MAG: 6,7-dimethyl-8-ribityllumazine synthase [Candidatus Dormibacteraceae bacterium]